MYPESELQPISALQHLAFCPRQWGLIHLEQAWEENALTAEGRVMHEKAHSDQRSVYEGLRVVRGLRIHSLRYGLIGIADVVEFIPCDPADSQHPGFPGVTLPGSRGRWTIRPVEYKRGRPKPDRCDEVQLCAQALCLEEMLGARIDEGAVFYGKPRRRSTVSIDDALRDYTRSLIERLHDLFRRGQTPTAEYSRKCRSCSLLEISRPTAMKSRGAASRYVRRALSEITKPAEEQT